MEGRDGGNVQILHALMRSHLVTVGLEPKVSSHIEECHCKDCDLLCVGIVRVFSGMYKVLYMCAVESRSCLPAR
eukprot:429256-Amphidinium_carterae.1